MAVVLLAAVVVGQQIGEHTIFGATQRRVEIPGQNVTPVPEDTPGPNEAISRNWKRLQVVSVATDPAFPDPRVTPPPTPTPTPPPRPTPSPTPLPTLSPVEIYTSPPLPIPLASHEPGEFPEP
ncbi:MAG TPA: hypothetical protein VIJ64_12715 [Candidatus Lustribacter sp.]